MQSKDPTESVTRTHDLADDWRNVGLGLRVRFSLRAGQLEAAWAPRRPTARDLRRVLDRYRAVRAGFLAHAYGASSGRRVLVLELAA